MEVIAPLYEAQRDKAIYLSGSRLNLRRPLETLASRLRDKRLDFLFRPETGWCSLAGKWAPISIGCLKPGSVDRSP